MRPVVDGELHLKQRFVPRCTSNSRVSVEARSAADRLADIGRGADQLHERLPLLLCGAELLAGQRHLNLRLQRTLLGREDTLDGRIVHG